jgi:hypothetical protein
MRGKELVVPVLSALRLIREFNVKREGDGKALILTCTKMKDAEEPERKAYDLRTAELYTDEDGELVCSLVVRMNHERPKRLILI